MNLRITNWKRYIVPFALLLLSVSVYFRWFTFDAFRSGDWFYHLPEEACDLRQISAWDASIQYGSFNYFLWRAPFYMVYGLGGCLGFGSNILEKFWIFWPMVLGLPLSAYVFLRQIAKSREAALVGAVFVSLNTYVLSINSVGHEFLIYGWIGYFLSLTYMIRFIKTLSYREILMAALVSLSMSLTEIRVLYMWFLTLPFLFGYLLVRNRFSRHRLIAIISAGLLLIGFVAVLNSYWLLPTFFSGNGSGGFFAERSLFATTHLSAFKSLTVFHPYWTGGTLSWFIPNDPMWYFVVLPLMAMMGFALNRKNAYALIFGLVAVLGVFLGKQNNEPFSSVYVWCFTYIPGFKLFREATKFYLFSITGYAVLFALFIDKIKEHAKIPNVCKKICMSLILVYLLIPAVPMVTGTIKGLYISKQMPAEYVSLYNQMKTDFTSYRMLWLPRESRWGYSTTQYPSLSPYSVNTAFLDAYAKTGYASYELEKKIMSIMVRPDADTLLDRSSVRYVAVPIETAADDDPFIGLGINRAELLGDLRAVPYLEEQKEGYANIALFINEGARPRIYLTQEQETLGDNEPYTDVAWQMRTSSEYQVTLTGVRGTVYLQFTDAYDPKWLVKGLTSQYPEVTHAKSDIGTNSYVIPIDEIASRYPEEVVKNSDGTYTFTCTLFYAPTKQYTIGLFITAFLFIGGIVYIGLSRKGAHYA